MRDLFDQEPPKKYPESPGFKVTGTSEDAAKAIEPRAGSLRARALGVLRQIMPEGMTPDQIAKKMGCTVLAVRPRITELAHANLIEKTGERRLNTSGVNADVWRAVS